MNNNNMWGWIIGIIIVLLVIFGIWWVSANNTGTPSNNSIDTTTQTDIITPGAGTVPPSTTGY
jgi:hypothetical protein